MGFDLEKVTKEYNQKQQQLTAEYVAEVSSSIKAAENQVKDCDFTIKEVSKIKKDASTYITKAKEALGKVNGR